MPTSTPDNPSIDDLHNSEFVNGGWRLKPAVVKKRLLQSEGRNKKKHAWKIPEIVNKQKQGDPPAGLLKTKKKVFLAPDQEELPDLSDKIWKENSSCQAVLEDLPGPVVRKPDTMEISKDLNRITEGEGYDESKVICAQKVDRKKVFHIQANQIAAKKVKTLKPVVRSVRKTRSMQKKDDENLMSEGTSEEEVVNVPEVRDRFTENVIKIQFEKNDGKVENKEVVIVGVNLKNKDIKTHKCSICDKTFEHKPNLVRHSVTVHQGVKPHQCEQCKKKFGLKQHLLRHLINIHQAVKPHHCKQCEKKFGQKQHLLRHLANVHQVVKPHKCEQCVEKFGLKITLKQHMLGTHHETK